MNRRDRRRAEARQALLAALKAHPDTPINPIIKRCSGLSTYRLYTTLYELEDAGEVVGYWRLRPLPKRRLYRLTKEE